MNEAEFQDRIKNKLEQKYGSVNVRATSGAAEHGVDLILRYDTTVFGEPIIIGLQLKAEPNMSAKTAQTAIGQVTVALSHEFTLWDDQPMRLDLAYIVNYGEFSNTALDYLSEAKDTLKALKWLSKHNLDAYMVDTMTSAELLGGPTNG